MPYTNEIERDTKAEVEAIARDIVEANDHTESVSSMFARDGKWILRVWIENQCALERPDDMNPDEDSSDWEAPPTWDEIGRLPI